MIKKKNRWLPVAVIVIAVAAIAAFAGVIVTRYFNYNVYKQYVQSYEVEEGGEFTALPDTGDGVEGMVLAAENENLKLYTNLKTTEIAVMEKENGHITYSNPVDRDEDPIASGVNKQLLNSTLNLVYYSSARSRSTMNNYDMSIQYEQFEVQALKDGIRYVYTLQDPENSTGIIPLQISEERMQNLILSKLDEKDARTARNYFTLKDGVYTLNEAAMDSKISMSRLNKFFEQCGYTVEDYELDMEGMEGAENISFTIPMEYRLTDNGLEVSIPAGEIKEGGGASIARIQVLPMFGAGGTDDEGYIVVPDGSGALIDFNNGTKNSPYTQNVYGIDPEVQSYTVTELTENARLPIFGIKNGDYAFLGRITGGDALGIINANVSGNTNSYNFAYAEFSTREIELLNMFGVSGNQSDVPVVEDELYDEKLSVTYTFLDGDDADYSGMANAYRSQLIAEGTLTKQAAGGTTPFYLDILGGVEIQKHVMGVPYTGIYPMTTYEQADQILDMLYKAGISDVRMSYQGWFNRGVYHDAADKVKLIKAVGSKSELEALSTRLEENGGKLFLDVAFQQVPYTSKRFNDVLEASKYFSGYVVSMGALNPATMRQTSTLTWYDELSYFIMSPRFLPWYVGHFRDAAADIDVSGYSLRDLGDVLASDKKRTDVIDRQEAEQVVVGQLKDLNATGKSLMANGGNAYAFGQVTDIVGAPTQYSKFYIVDQQIPFYEMVIHGCIDYSGQSLNLMDQDADEEMVLSFIEYGVAPRFTFSYEDSSNIKYTSSADMYSVCYTTWMEDAQDIYEQISGALSKVQGAEMIHHEVLDNGLAAAEYDNGVMIYVNKTDEALDAGGVTVEPMSYKITGGAS